MLLQIDSILRARRQLDVGRSLHLVSPSRRLCIIPKYRLRYFEKNEARATREEVFSGLLKKTAFGSVRALLGIKGKITDKKFRDAGGESLYFGDILILPRRKRKGKQ